MTCISSETLYSKVHASHTCSAHSVHVQTATPRSPSQRDVSVSDNRTRSSIPSTPPITDRSCFVDSIDVCRPIDLAEKLCGVCVCVLCCVLCCVVCVCVVWCVARLGTQKKPSCADSKRPRVYRHNAHMCYHMRAWCRYTRGRFESAHGRFWDGHTEERGGKEGEGRGVTVSSAIHETAHVELSRASERFTERNPWFLPIHGLRTGREQHVLESSNHSLYLMKLLRDTAVGISTHNTHIRTNTYSPPTHPPPLSSMYTHVYMCMCVYAYVYVYVHVYVYVYV